MERTEVCLGQLPATVMNTWDKTAQKEKKFPLAHSLDIFVHDWWAFYAGPVVTPSIMVKITWQRKTIHSMAQACKTEEEDRAGSWHPFIPFEGIPCDLKTSH